MLGSYKTTITPNGKLSSAVVAHDSGSTTAEITCSPNPSTGIYGFVVADVQQKALHESIRLVEENLQRYFESKAHTVLAKLEERVAEAHVCNEPIVCNEFQLTHSSFHLDLACASPQPLHCEYQSIVSLLSTGVFIGLVVKLSSWIWFKKEKNE